MEMEFNLEEGTVKITLPVNTKNPPPSRSTGKSLMIAKEGGKVLVEGIGEVRYGVNLYIPNPAYKG